MNSPRKTQAEIESKVREYLEKSGFTDPVTISVTGAGGASGASLVVHVTYSYNFQMLPNFIQSLTGSLGLTAETVMLME